VRAAAGRATLRRRRARPVKLVLVPVGECAAVLKRCVEKVPGTRPHIPVDRHEPVEAFETIAADFPVFRVIYELGGEGSTLLSRWISSLCRGGSNRWYRA